MPELKTGKDLDSSHIQCRSQSVTPAPTTKKIGDQRKKSVKRGVSSTTEVNPLALTLSTSWSQTLWAMSTETLENISSDQRLTPRIFPISPSGRVELKNWSSIPSSCTWKNLTRSRKDQGMFQRAWTQDQLLRLSRNNINTLRTLTRERRTWENWITREEQLWSWIKISLIPRLSSSMEPSILSERHMGQKSASSRSISQRPSPRSTAPSKSVTYQSRGTTELLGQILLTWRTQSKTQWLTKRISETQSGETQRIPNRCHSTQWALTTKIQMDF